jgi:hypothetical protein
MQKVYIFEKLIKKWDFRPDSKADFEPGCLGIPD